MINGRAKTNLVNSCAGDSTAAEGGAIGYYGGNDDNDCSGALRYVRVEFAGKEITPNNELNSFTWCACGRNTKGDYLQAYYGADDSFEWFGGAMDQKHLVATDGTDDGYDWQMGTRNRTQFVIIRPSPRFAPSGGQNGDKGIEADDNEFDFNATQCSGRSNCTLANFTIVGDKRVGAAFPGPAAGANFRRGTAATLVNSIITNFKTSAVKIDDNATLQAHCAAPPEVLALPLQDQSGASLSFGEFFLGRTAIAVFFYTRCANPAKCPLTASRLGRLQRRLAAEGLPIRTAGFTYDPAYDMPERLAWYADCWGVHTGEDHRLFRSPAGLAALRSFFELGVNFSGAGDVNRHQLEAFVLDPRGAIVRAVTRRRWDEGELIEAARRVG